MLLFLSPRSTQRIVHGVVSFMACVFENLVPRLLRDRIPDGKGLRECLWIVDDRLIVHRVWSRSREPLRHFQRIAGGCATAIQPNSRSIRQKVGRFDDEGVSFPMAAGIAHVGFNVRAW